MLEELLENCEGQIIAAAEATENIKCKFVKNMNSG